MEGTAWDEHVPVCMYNTRTRKTVPAQRTHQHPTTHEIHAKECKLTRAAALVPKSTLRKERAKKIESPNNMRESTHTNKHVPRPAYNLFDTMVDAHCIYGTKQTYSTRTVVVLLI